MQPIPHTARKQRNLLPALRSLHDRCLDLSPVSGRPLRSRPPLFQGYGRSQAGRPVKARSGLFLALRAGPTDEHSPPCAFPSLFLGKARGPFVSAAPPEFAHYLADNSWVYSVAFSTALGHLKTLYLAAW